MGQDIGQTSRHAPSVVFDGSMFHMVFSANDDSNRILYVTSSGGLNNWTLGPSTEQTSGAAPSLGLCQMASITGPGLTRNVLVLVFVANDPSQRVLYSTLDLTQPPNARTWQGKGQVGGESATGVSLLGTSFVRDGNVTVYFTSNDPSNRLLEHQFVP